MFQIGAGHEGAAGDTQKIFFLILCKFFCPPTQKAIDYIVISLLCWEEHDNNLLNIFVLDRLTS